jgi:ferredoxin
MKVFVDSTKCSGYGACADHCPSLFELDEWGYAAVIGDGTVPADAVAGVQAAAADCPEHAINVTD